MSRIHLAHYGSSALELEPSYWLRIGAISPKRWAFFIEKSSGSTAHFVHHIIDPATGLPAAVTWRVVSVGAATCVEANAAATASR